MSSAHGRLLLAAGLLLLPPALAGLSGPVGPLKTAQHTAQKKVCNILKYGGAAGATGDIGGAIAAAWSACRAGGHVYIPPGEYGLKTRVSLSGGNGVSINIDGIIYRTGTAGGTMIAIDKSTDIEVYSSTGRGAIQGYGYAFHQHTSGDGASGPRILRLTHVSRFSVHDLALVDSPSFHFTLDTCADGEVYNMVIHGRYLGGLDGLDVWGTNLWIHDIEVSNKDECVTVKSPARHVLVEAVHCNWSGGCAMGSLGTDTDISDIEYRNIYTHHSNQMFMIKSRGGSGSVRNVVLHHFSGHSNAYTLDVDSDWGKAKAGLGPGISFTDVRVADWQGSSTDGQRRPPVRLKCPALRPCTGIDIQRFAVWSERGPRDVVYQCENAFGTGACLRGLPRKSAPYRYTATQRVIQPAGTQMAVAGGGGGGENAVHELPHPFYPTAGVPIPQLPRAFFPGRKPLKAVLRAH